MTDTHDTPQSVSELDPHTVRAETTRIVKEMRVIDMHTHLFPPEFEQLASWGIDDLLTYH
jgi:hypothetical protein